MKSILIPVGEPLTGTELKLAGLPDYTGQQHQLSVCEYGNPDGIPVIFIHGGPGAGTCPNDTTYFDLTKYRVFLLDQRGSGQSMPRNCLEGNNTANLIEDIETVRQTLNLDKIMLFGGSWGSTLSLLYAIKYPQNVLGMVLRGIFLGEKTGIEAFFREDSNAVKSNPAEWRQFIEIAFPDDSLRQAYDNAPLEAKFDILANGLFNEIKAGRWREVGLAYAKWEIINAIPAGEAREEAISECGSEDDITMGLTEIFYIINKLWLTEGYIMSHVDHLAGIPIKIVQGDNDDICPPQEQAYKLHAQLMTMNPELITLIKTDGGHFASNPPNAAALKDCMEAFSMALCPTPCASTSNAPVTELPSFSIFGKSIYAEPIVECSESSANNTPPF